MLFGCLVLSYNISQIGSILHNMREAANEVKHELATFKRLAKANHIDEKLQQSVARYIINSANIKSSF